MCNIDDLPNELLSQIFDLVDTVTTHRLLRVSKRWNEVAYEYASRRLELNDRQVRECPLYKERFKTRLRHLAIEISPSRMLRPQDAEYDWYFGSQSIAAQEDLRLHHLRLHHGPPSGIDAVDVWEFIVGHSILSLPSTDGLIEGWRNMLRNGYGKFAAAIFNLRELKTFSLTTPRQADRAPEWESLHSYTTDLAAGGLGYFMGLLAIPDTMTSLDLDLFGIFRLDRVGSVYCRELTRACTRLKSLQSLYLRFDFLHEDLFNCDLIVCQTKDGSVPLLWFRTLTMQTFSSGRERWWGDPYHAHMHKTAERVRKSKRFMPNLERGRLIHKDNEENVCGHDLVEQEKFRFIPSREFLKDRYALGEERDSCLHGKPSPTFLLELL